MGKPPWEVPPAPLPAELVAWINETRTVSIYEADQYAATHCGRDSASHVTKERSATLDEGRAS